MMAGRRPRANLIFSGQVNMSLFRRMARMPLLQEAVSNRQSLQNKSLKSLVRAPKG